MVRTDFEKLVLEKLDSLQTDVSGLKEDVGILKQDVSGLKEDVGILKQDFVRFSVKQDMIFEQTAGLLEFKIETKSTLAEIRDTQKTVIHILGEHEVEIRNIKRRAL
ncbi:MAG: hypothetical protein DDT30_00220 [Dehalococcoidia bacterium]|nr:hypothetical protein [Bacillota bacterium]